MEYCQFEPQIHFHNTDFVFADDVKPNLILTLITGSLSMYLVHKMLLHSVVNESLLVVGNLWYKRILEIYGLKPFSYEVNKPRCMPIELIKNREQMEDMNLSIIRVSIDLKKFVKLSEFCFKKHLMVALER